MPCLSPFRKTLCAALAIGCSASFSVMAGTGPALTIYNGNFAVVRDNLELPLKKGVNEVRYQDITRQLEPDSVVLRSRDKQFRIQVLEQNYLANVISQSLLLQHFEGKTIDFEVQQNQKTVIIPGKIIRGGNDITPIIEMQGKTRFGLPGQPLFPALQDNTLLKPTLEWQLDASAGGKVPLELAYITAGLNWKADYNIVSRPDSDKVSLNGWVTFSNHSGEDFRQATIKLMAGDVNKVQPQRVYMARAMKVSDEMASQNQVTEKAFDEYHLYSLPRTLDLHDQETKQVEFVTAATVTAHKLFVYDGAATDGMYPFSSPQDLRNAPNYGTGSNSKVWIMREFANTKANGLGIPLPKGRVRFYQEDEDGQLEFLGENNIDHTPKDETIRLYTGNAFNITGKRERTDYKINNQEHWIRESFLITLKNHGKTKAPVTVVEHLYRWNQWDIEKTSAKFTKKDANTIEYREVLAPDETQSVSYTVRYHW